MKSLRQKIVAMAAVVAVSGLMMASVAGATPKLIVKDNATPTPNNVFTVDEAGTITGSTYVFKPSTKKYGFGTANPLSSLHITEEQQNLDRGLTIAQHYSAAGSAVININRSRGTEASPVINSSGDFIASFHAKPYDGQPWTPPALPVYTATATFQFQVDGATSAGNIPTAMQFWTGANAATRLERFRIASDGRVRYSNQPAAPANNATCTVGDTIFDAPNGYLYLCVATNSWKRASFTAY